MEDELFSLAADMSSDDEDDESELFIEDEMSALAEEMLNQDVSKITNPSISNYVLPNEISLIHQDYSLDISTTLIYPP